MARIRTIKPTFWEDELIGAMPPIARLVFVGLFSLADDAGRMRSSASWVRSQLFAYDETTSTSDVETILVELHRTRRIRLYGNGQRYLEVVNFAKHQRIQKPQPSQLPAPGSHYPVVPIEGAPEQEIPHLLSDSSTTGINGSGVEVEVSGSGLRPSPSSAKRRPASKKEPTAEHLQAVACFDWYCEQWNKTGMFAISLTSKRLKAIEAALKERGPQAVAAAIRGHLTNPWRHEHLNRNDITVLLRPENIDAGIELAAKAAGHGAPSGTSGTSKDDTDGAW